VTFLATTRVAVLRNDPDAPGAESPLGDEVEQNDAGAIVPALADMPAELIERSKGVYDPATNTRRTVRYVACRIPVAVADAETGDRIEVALAEGDRLKDLRTGIIYAIEEHVAVPRSLAGQSSLTLDLRATASARNGAPA